MYGNTFENVVGCSDVDTSLMFFGCRGNEYNLKAIGKDEMDGYALAVNKLISIKESDYREDSKFKNS